MPISFAGGCAFGAIRYECNGEPLTMFHCHCRDCQRATSAPYSSVIGMPEAAFNLLQGMPHWYSAPSTAGGLLDRGFCSDCGSPLFGRGEMDAETPFMGIHASSLDGRQELWEDSPEGYSQTPTYEWWIWLDEPNKTDEDRPGLVQLRATRVYSKDRDAT
jgi:hypothetical protein